MTFAWQGFLFRHPDDWAPSLISGNRDEGYVRIASPEVFSYQVRWNRQKSADLTRSVNEYLTRLKHDAAKLKVAFKSKVEPDGNGIDYRWSGAGNGRGRIERIGERTFFIEASSTTNRSCQSAFQELRSSFDSPAQDPEFWCVLGLAVRLPAGLTVERHVFHTGRTRIEWKGVGGRILAERWGFGKQLLSRHTFEDWAMQSMNMAGAKVHPVPEGLELERSRLGSKAFGLAAYDEDSNQLVTLKVTTRNSKWRPTWDWLT